MITLCVVKETDTFERRVAISADMVKKYIALGLRVMVESHAGSGSAISDEAYTAAGAEIFTDKERALRACDILLTVEAPHESVTSLLKPGAILIGMLSPYNARQRLSHYATQQISAFSMELLPRTSRAQAMDVLSSQANLAGYRAVIDAVYMLAKATPMLMTAAGTIAPAKVLVLGAGVAGLQAIATAKRLGCVVYAFDVRPVAREQVESLGAKFIEVVSEESTNAETKGGYAIEMSEAYKQKQADLIAQTLTTMDAAISTALIPGKPAPVLITEAMVKAMKPGSVIVDLAVGSGGNCPLSRADEVVEAHGITIMGYTHMPSRVATDATPLYARNLLNFVSLLVTKEKQISIPLEDDLIKGSLLTHQGAIIHPQFM